MRRVLCPISIKQLDATTIRLSNFLLALVLGTYVWTDNILFLLIVLVDYSVSVLLPERYSPLLTIANEIVRVLRLKRVRVEAAPKIFTRRFGLFMGTVALTLSFIWPIGGIVAALTLMSLNLLESVLDLCLGSFLYNVVVYPFFNGRGLSTTL